jgi:RNA polymerase sigma-70 factor (ECF subfamily)
MNVAKGDCRTPLGSSEASVKGALQRARASLRGAPLRLAPTRANPQPAFGCYRPCPQAPIARPYGMIVLTLEDDRICAITWFSDSSVFPHFGLPRTLPR